MKICVLNGSPKGEYSATLHTVLYLQERFPADTFEVLHVGRQLRAFERDMERARAVIEAADMLLFAYPVYTFIAPYQLHRFIELLKESDIAYAGKLAAQITTSKHFYDVTAHAYIKDNCADMELRYLGGLSADMEDLLCAEGRAQAEGFWRYITFAAANGITEPSHLPTPMPVALYTASLTPVPKCASGEVVIVTNAAADDTSLHAMIEDFRVVCTRQTKVVNIGEYPFAGGCLGCFNCAVDGSCVYRDGFDRYLREHIQTAEAIIYAFTIKDHSMGASFKLYDDRQFCNGHRTVTMGMPMGYLIRGDLSAEPNVRMIIDGRCDVGHNVLVGCATDAPGIVAMAQRLTHALEDRYIPPQTFYGVGGLKIFRDLIFVMRGMMKADHKFYKSHGFYDFPQKQRATIFKMKLVGMLLSNKKLKAKMGSAMKEGMIAPYKKVLAQIKEQKDI